MTQKPSLIIKTAPAALAVLPMPTPSPTKNCWNWRLRFFFRQPSKTSLPKKTLPKSTAPFCASWPTAPTTPDADDILHEKGIFVLPDFLANAGGVTVSYLEQVQNTYNLYWNLDEIHFRLKDTMCRSFHSVYEMSRSNAVHMRNAAYLVSVARVAEACKLRGWV